MTFTANTANNIHDLAAKIRKKERAKRHAVAGAADGDAPFLSQIRSSSSW
jgi:hypothetical protein